MEEKPQGILIGVESGQIIPAIPMQWTLEDTDTDEAVTEPAEPMRFTKSFTLKMPKMKETKRKKLIRTLAGKQKLSRKLKKACKHIHHVNNQKFIEHKDKGPLEFEIIGYQGFVVNNGYPNTKWVRKAIKACNRIISEAALKILEEMDKEMKGKQP